MKKMPLLLIIFLLTRSLVFAQQDPNDPGIQDSLIIDSVFILQGQSLALVPVFAASDDSVAIYNIPLHWSPEGIGVRASSIQNFWPLNCWSVWHDTTHADTQYIDLLGGSIFMDTTQEPCYMNTDSTTIHIFSIRFLLPQDLPPMTITIDTACDNRNGSLAFGLADGLTGFTPAFRIGAIIIINPASTNDISVPLIYSLNQNYPNPFNPSTNIEFALSHAGHVRLEIFDILGQRIKLLADAKMEVGKYSITWNGSNVSGADAPSGTYFYKLSSNEFTETKKMILIR